MPRMRYTDVVSRVKSISNVTGQDVLIKEGIQMSLDRILEADLPYLMTDGVITTVATYETGTVTATNGSKTITGSGTTFTSAMVGRKIRVNNENAYYKIATFVSTTELTLEIAYQGTTASAQTYSIYKDEYRLPADCNTYKVMRQIKNAESIISLEASAFDVREPAPSSEGNPNFEILVGSKLDTYLTGTVSGTVNLSVLTGSSTVWTGVEGLGKGSRVTIGTNVYTVKSVDSDTQITIYEKFVVTISAATYSILLDNLIVQFFEIPSTAQDIYFRYQRLAFPLINDEDIPDLPDQWHWLLIVGGLIWAWAVKDKAESLLQEQRFELLKLECWKRLGYIARSRTYPRISQDVLHQRFLPNYAEGYGIPFNPR